MPDLAENNDEVKRSKAEVAVYRITFVLLLFLLLASFFMALLSPYMGGGFFSYLFLLSPVLVIIALIGVGLSNKNRSKILKRTQENIANGNLPQEKKIKNYGLRLLIMFGVVVFGSITLGIFSIAISSATNLLKGDITVIVGFIIAGIGAFGTFKLIQLLHQ